MKQGFRYLSIFLIITVLGSAIFVGSSTFVLADTPGSYSNLYWGDFADMILDNCSSNQISTANTIISYVESNWNNPDFNIWIIIDENTGNFAFLGGLNQATGTHAWYLNSWTGPTEFQPRLYSESSGERSYFREKIGGIFYNGSFTVLSTYNISVELPAKRSAFNFSSLNIDYVYCTPFEWNQSGVKCYSLRTVTGYKSSSYTLNSNIQDTPIIQEYDLRVFYVGTSLYMTASDQLLMARMNPETMGYVWKFIVLDQDYDSRVFEIHYSAITYIPNIELYCPGLDNLPDNGTGKAVLVPDIWTDIVDAKFVSYDELERLTIVANAVNTPYDLEEDIPSQEQIIENTYITSYNQYNEYLEAYNTTHIVPQNLGALLYGLDGSMTMPVEVVAPDSMNSGQLIPSHVFQYHFPFQDDPAFDFDLMDVVIFENNEFVNYHLRYYYTDLVNPSYKNVDWYTFDSLLHQFDVIIIISDDRTMLTESGISIAYCGSNGDGVAYHPDGFDYDDPFLDYSNTMVGFAFVTQKGIQKQQLLNFNNGITKTYKLMSDYISKRDDWDDSFLLWSASIYNMLDTLNGRINMVGDKLGSIYDLLLSWDLSSILDDIASKLEEIVNNTAANDSDLNPWYISLWNFVSSFVPTNEQFQTSLNAIEDIGDEIPAIPTLSPVITLPPLPGGE